MSTRWYDRPALPYGDVKLMFQSIIDNDKSAPQNKFRINGEIFIVDENSNSTIGSTHNLTNDQLNQFLIFLDDDNFGGKLRDNTRQTLKNAIESIIKKIKREDFFGSFSLLY